MTCIASDLQAIEQGTILRGSGTGSLGSLLRVVGWLPGRPIRWMLVDLPFGRQLEWDSDSELLHTCP